MIAKMPMAEAPNIEKTDFSRKVRCMLGLDLHSWEQLMLLSLGIAGLIALAVFITTAAVVILQRHETAEAKKELEEYKLTVESKVADAKKEGIEAGKTAGNALVRAAELEKETEELRKNNLELAAAVSPRVFEQTLITEALRPFSDVTYAIFAPSDFEPRSTAGQLKYVLANAGWRPYEAPIPQRVLKFFPGVVVHVVNGSTRGSEAATALISELEKNGIEAKTSFPMPRFDEEGKMLPGASGPGPPALVIEVGSKPLPKALQLDPKDIPAGARGAKAWGNIME
jgi:hypothetical protein